MKKRVAPLVAAIMMSGLSLSALAAGPKTIHLDEYNGYFAAEETLADLEPGKYTFIITNKAEKVVGFQLQNGTTHAQLDMFPLEPGQTRSTTVNITADGFRYRCPINPTPWYDLNVN